MAQRADYKPHCRASQNDGEPDVERHPSTVGRVNEAHFNVPSQKKDPFGMRLGPFRERGMPGPLVPYDCALTKGEPQSGETRICGFTEVPARAPEVRRVTKH